MRKITILLCCLIMVLFACNTVVFDEPQPAIDLRSQSQGNSFSNPIELQRIPDRFQGIFTMDEGKDTIKIFPNKIYIGTAHFNIHSLLDKKIDSLWYHLGEDLVVIQDGNQYFFNICVLTEEQALDVFEVGQYHADEPVMEKEDSLMISALTDKWQCLELESKNEDIKVYPFSYEMQKANETILAPNSFEDFENMRVHKNNIQHINASFIMGEKEDDYIWDFDVVLMEDMSYQGFWKLLKAAKIGDENELTLNFHQNINPIQE